MEYKADGQRQHWSTTTTTSPAPPSAAPTTTTTTTTSATASLALIGAHSKCRQLSVFLAESRRLVIPQPQQQRILLQGLLSVHPSLLLFASPDSHSPTVAQDRPSTASFLHLGVYVEVVCIAVDHRFGHGAARAGPLNSVDRLLFHETIHLTNHFQQQQQQERDRDPNSAAHSSSLDHLRFPFVFDLSRISSLPPSANSDAGLSMETLTSSNTSDTHSALGLKNTGITWELHGFVAERRDVDDLGLVSILIIC